MELADTVDLGSIARAYGFESHIGHDIEQCVLLDVSIFTEGVACRFEMVCRAVRSVTVVRECKWVCSFS